MLGRKKPAPEPLSLSNPGSNATRRLQQNLSGAQSSGVESPSPSSATSPIHASRSPKSAAPSPSLRSRIDPTKRPQTAKATSPTSEAAGIEALDFGHRRPSQPSHNLPHSASTNPSAAAQSPTEHQHPPVTPHLPSQERRNRSGLFHFTKPSRTTNHLPSHSHRPSASWNQLDSTRAEGPGVARHGDGEQCRPDISYPNTDFNIKPSLSDTSLASAPEREVKTVPNSPKRTKAKGFGRLTRTKSHRDKEGGKYIESLDPMPSISTDYDAEGEAPPPRTAPVAQDRSFRDMMDSQSRNRSASRSREHHREKESRGRATPPPARDNGGSTFLSGLRNSSTKAAGMFGKGFFGKTGRSGAAHERPAVVDDEHYELKVLNLPLVVQTRKTRISKRLENSRDKTEFWMPAFPWRAIDYLNYKGCEVEGLYRVPGSGPQIKRWQRRFDEEHDVNLFEVEDLYDINVVGSMLKAWLRELPDELFPKAAQERVLRESYGSEKVPQSLIDELSNLAPFQYYLLFAITCHLSLLLAHSDKNKMDFRNLCICFQPCMRIDSFCFKFLVCDWRDCWKGCRNEAAYIEQEYILFDQPPPRGFVDPSQERPLGTDTQAVEEDQDRPQQQAPQKRPDEIPRKKIQSRPSEQQSSERIPSRKPSRDEEGSSPPVQEEPQTRDVGAAIGNLQARRAPDTPEQHRGQSSSQNTARSRPTIQTQERSEKQRPSSAVSHKSDSSYHSYHSANDKPTDPVSNRVQPSDSKGSLSSGDRTISTTLTIHSDREPPSRGGELRPLSPIKPLSPLGFQ